MALTALARDWDSQAKWLLKAALPQWNIVSQKVIVEVWVYWGSRRRQDCDNLLKALLDALTGIVYTDDKWAVPRVMDWDIDDKNPRVEVIARMM